MAAAESTEEGRDPKGDWWNRFEECLSTGVPYYSQQYVSIQNLKLGLFYWSIVFGGALWVFVDHALYQGLHLLERKGVGGWWASLQQPTVEGCSPDTIGCVNNYSASKSYCNQSASARDHHLPVSHPIRKCLNFDGDTLLRLRDNGILVPTHMETYHMQLQCESLADCANGVQWTYLDENGDAQKGKGPAYPVADVFVNDIESYTLRLDHSIQVPTRDGSVRSHHSAELNGMLETGAGQKDVAATAIRGGPAPGREIYATPLGDVFRIGKLAELTGHSIDELLLHGPDAGTSRRLSGATLLLSITYTMRAPWVGLKVLPWSGPVLPEYLISVHKKRADRKGLDEVTRSAGSTGDVRSVRTIRGLTIVIEQEVTVLEWSWSHVTVILMTVAGVAKFAKFLIRMLIVYLLPGSENVAAAVYEKSNIALHGVSVLSLTSRPASSRSRSASLVERG